MISCTGLTRVFGPKRVVNDISFSLPRGSICAFLGPNGAGKSTTLKMLTGLLHPTSGMASVAGMDVFGEQDSLTLKRRIGVMPEGLGLFDELSVEEHLHLCGPIYGLSRDETRIRANQLLRALDLEDGRHTYAYHCSHGMRKKTALAMALLHNPEVLFLDEPFEGIDPVTAELIRDLLLTLAERGVTIFFTSHLLAMAERLASHCIVIRQGQIAWDSKVAELPATLQELYFGLIDPRPLEALPWLGSRPS
jgi:ABC-2 type transport system ATP-binding protein